MQVLNQKTIQQLNYKNCGVNWQAEQSVENAHYKIQKYQKKVNSKQNSLIFLILSQVSKILSCHPQRVFKELQFEHKRSSFAQLVQKICMFKVVFDNIEITDLHFHVFPKVPIYLFMYFHSCCLSIVIKTHGRGNYSSILP